MRTCCICGTHWKESDKEKTFKIHSLIYGCHKCYKGHHSKNEKQNYFMFGEFVKEKKKK